MSTRKQCDFYLVRYVPDPVRNEFVNIGVLLRDVAQPEQITVNFTKDWARVRCIDPDVDVAMLESLESELRRRLAHQGSDATPLMRVFEDSFSTGLQITEPRAYLAESMIAGVEELMRLFVEPRKRQASARKTGRQAIQAKMRSQFERAGVWDLMRKRISVSRYTKTGDPLRIDCGYRPNGLIRMFHAVSLDSDTEWPKVLAFSVESIREGVARIENAELELTAIVEPIVEVSADREDVERVEQYRFSVETMEEQDIRVITTNDLPRMAETAQREFRL
ncbi:DUF3037 domain-containing protein [Alloacidobacterium dinghuense]|uniref:DUF3037 domain-containing protein n=1 Tax=Alloacidobacterium dinghuense TaxID=2763107 RepID=A0A7G8BGE8_9BACT|nr:DUF3037 domain-containing protein [Alloacidobacterium dinghuense]QNI31618.1 DUF3037 domain-containing protein [Alloacidobacterium dinghuense]